MNVKLEQILVSYIDYSLVSRLFSTTYRKSPKVRNFRQKTLEITTVFFATKPEAAENYGLIFGGSKQPPKINDVG